jgi:hypothetical protein
MPGTFARPGTERSGFQVTIPGVREQAAGGCHACQVVIGGQGRVAVEQVAPSAARQLRDVTAAQSFAPAPVAGVGQSAHCPVVFDARQGKAAFQHSANHES